MKRVVWKYALDPGWTTLRLAIGSRLVAVGPVDPGADQPAVWVETWSDQPLDMTARLLVVGTGHPIPPGVMHLGSAWCGPYMWHVYEAAST